MAAALLAAGSAAAAAQTATPARPAPSPFVSVSAPVIALTHARLIDGTGTPARDDQTIVIADGKIEAVGPASRTTIPVGARTIDLAGKMVIPGIVGLHDHMYYGSRLTSTRPMLQSYPKLFLASGVTTIRTTGSIDPYQEINLRQSIETGKAVGPE